MEVKTKEIRRYICLEFDEGDLIKFRDEINLIIPKIDSYNDTAYRKDEEKISTEKIKEFKNVLNNALHDILRHVDYKESK